MRRRNAGEGRFAGGRRPRIDLFELAVLGVFLGLSLWVVALDLWQVVAHDRSWTGTDGGYGLPDQMQHLAWVRDASSHVLVSNLFIVENTPHNYLQPAVVVSAALAAIGVAPWLALLLWKPVAVSWVFLAVRAYVHRSLDGTVARRGRSSSPCSSSDGARSYRRSSRHQARGPMTAGSFTPTTGGWPSGRGGMSSGCCPWERWSVACWPTNGTESAAEPARPRRCSER